MKLRQVLEDFKVEELSDLPQGSDGGDYRIYLLEKRGLETFSLISYLSVANKVPFSEFGYAGLKDRHAITRQLLSLPAGREITTLHERSFDIEPVGYADHPIGPGALKANRFEIVVRDLKERDFVRAEETALDEGSRAIPNYFDSQRFGSVPWGEFTAKHILKSDYGSALKVYLTHYGRKEKRSVKEDKKRILAAWDDLSGAEVKSKHLARTVEAYLRTGSYEEAYMSIPRNIRELMLSAYQSHLWNECVKVLLKEHFGTDRLLEVDHPLGKLLFPKCPTASELGSLPAAFPVIGTGLRTGGPEMRTITEVLGREGIALEDFERFKGQRDRFRTYSRDVLVRPEGFFMSGPARDELNGSEKAPRFKLTLRFTLPKGSYATIVTKWLFMK